MNGGKEPKVDSLKLESRSKGKEISLRNMKAPQSSRVPRNFFTLGFQFAELRLVANQYPITKRFAIDVIRTWFFFNELGSIAKSNLAGNRFPRRKFSLNLLIDSSTKRQGHIAIGRTPKFDDLQYR